LGYEGKSLDSFVSTLKSHSIECLLDVREMPLSRKKGFSKTALMNHLKENHIQYIHLKELGSPKDIRKKLKETHDYEVFFVAMEEHLSKVRDSIDLAYRYIIKNKSCLLCFEREAEYCHRRLVAQKIKEKDGNGLKISNL
jgi:uncharacterized protein (DUF488 family)